jgi:hypothetical protein
MGRRFPHLKFLRDRESEATRARWNRLDNLVRAKAGQEPVPMKPKPRATTLAKGPDPDGRMMHHQPRAGMCQLKGRRS